MRSMRHDGLPVGVRHVGHQHLALGELAHLIDAGQDVHLDPVHVGAPKAEGQVNENAHNKCLT